MMLRAAIKRWGGKTYEPTIWLCDFIRKAFLTGFLVAALWVVVERRRSIDKREMTRTQYDRDSVIDAAMQIIHDEHCFFINHAIDNAEHIPRIVRIAESVGKLLATGGMTKPDVEANVERIIHYGRQLFIEEWMKPFPGDTEALDEEDAIEEFDRYAKNARKRKTKRSSNQ